MTQSYFDVVVVGADPAAVYAAALLGKRGFRVLLVGQGDPAPDYAVEDVRLPRAPFVLPATHGAVAARIFRELALWQVVRRRGAPPAPPLQVVVPGHRLDLGDDERLGAELEREFPEARRPIEDFLRAARAASERHERWAERDLVWPPTTFLERREHERAHAGALGATRGDPLRELPERHPFRQVVSAVTRLAAPMDPDQREPHATLRLWSSWVDGGLALPGGAAELRSLLLERVTAYGGELRLEERVRRVLVRRGTVEGVTLAGSGERIGAEFVVAGLDLARLLRLLEDRAPFEELFERLGEPRPRYFRFTLNVVLARAGLPEGMGSHVFFVRDRARPLDGANLLRVQRLDLDGDRAALVAEALLPRRSVEEEPGFLAGVRERVLGALGELVPFVGNHVLLVDSPHDGRDAAAPRRRAVAPPEAPWARGPGTMEPVFAYPVRSVHGLCAFPVRTPVRRLLLCGAQVVPGLGEEGRWLAAWSAARVVSRSDRRPARLRRGLWTRLEL